jgi:hypothetical protein
MRLALPEFFVPHTESRKQAEEVWQATRKFAEEQLGWAVSDRRIFRIEYRHNGKEEEAEVGKTERRQREPVMVILESQSFLVCTPTRGVAKGEPILIGIPSRIVDFD